MGVILIGMIKTHLPNIFFYLFFDREKNPKVIIDRFEFVTLDMFGQESIIFKHFYHFCVKIYIILVITCLNCTCEFFSVILYSHRSVTFGKRYKLTTAITPNIQKIFVFKINKHTYFLITCTHTNTHIFINLNQNDTNFQIFSQPGICFLPIFLILRGGGGDKTFQSF